MKTRLLIICILAITVVSGCANNSPPPGPPPVEVHFRKSQIPLKGLVMGVRNTSTSSLEIATVSIRSPDDDGTRSHVITKRVLPKDSITIGWMELDGWKLKEGDEITLECTGYEVPFSITVTR